MIASDAVVVIGASIVVIAFNWPSVAKVLKRLVPADVPRLVEGRIRDRIVSEHGWLRD